MAFNVKCVYKYIPEKKNKDSHCVFSMLSHFLTFNISSMPRILCKWVHCNYTRSD